jgi:hypothetical protein
MSTTGSCYEKDGKETFKIIVFISVLLEIITSTCVTNIKTEHSQTENLPCILFQTCYQMQQSKPLKYDTFINLKWGDPHQYY